jgi:hypothetical protein
MYVGVDGGSWCLIDQMLAGFGLWFWIMIVLQTHGDLEAYCKDIFKLLITLKITSFTGVLKSLVLDLVSIQRDICFDNTNLSRTNLTFQEHSNV